MEPPQTDAGPQPGSPPPLSAPPGGWPGPRRLRRRPQDGHIAGVCAGVADYFNVDPVIVRIAAVVLAFSGSGVAAYILAWIFVPEAKGSDRFANRGPIDRKDRTTQIFGIVLLALAVSVIWGDWWSPARHWLLPFGLMALGAWLLLRRDDEDDRPIASPPVPPSPTAAAPWAWAATTGDLTDPAAAPSTEPDPTAPIDDPTTVLGSNSGDGAGGVPPTAPWDVPQTPPPPLPPVSSRRRRLLGPIVFGALLIWSGLAWLAGVTVENGLAVGLCILGLGFVLGAFVGGSRALIIPALLVAGALALTTVVDIPLSGAIGEQRWTPQRIADVDGRYEVSLGEGTLDLSAIELDSGDRLPIDVSVGIGHLVVLVPADLALDVTTEVGTGESQVLGLQQNGVGISTSQFDDEGTTGGTVVLDLQVGIGQIEVRRVSATGDGRSATSASTTTSLG